MGVPARQPNDGESRLLVTARERDGRRLFHPALSHELDDPTPAELALSAQAARAPHNLWLCGGEPTLRADLPELVVAVSQALAAPIGLSSDGLAFRAPEHAERLVQAGLVAVRVRVHSARTDAHDWLTAVRGSATRALRAAKLLAKLGLRVEIEAVATRVNAPYLGELVLLAAELGASAVHVERLVLSPRLAHDAVALGPRLGLTEPYFEQASEAATASGVRLRFHGFPECALGAARDAAAPPTEWITPARWPGERVSEPVRRSDVRCHGCSETCGGAPSDYVARFGALEFLSERRTTNQLAPASPRPKPRPRDDVLAPPPRGDRSPATRLRVVRELSLVPELGGDPLVPRGVPEPAATLRVRWRGTSPLAPAHKDEPEQLEPEPTREIRMRLVRASQYGARRLRVVGDALLTHPALADLLAELGRLSVPELELCAEGGALATLPEATLAAFSLFRRVDAPLFGATRDGHNARVLEADSFERTLAGVARLSSVVPVPVGVFGVLDDAASFHGFAEAWASGALPGDARFRLSARGGSLDELSEQLASATHAPSRAALAAVLPRCLLSEPAAWESEGELGPEFYFRPEARSASACDRLGQYRPCCRGVRDGSCPGVAVGWTTNRIESA